MGCGQGSKIVRSWVNLRAPTGENVYYQTEDGRVWHDVPNTLRPRPTGESYGYRDGDRMVG